MSTKFRQRDVGLRIQDSSNFQAQTPRQVYFGNIATYPHKYMSYSCPRTKLKCNVRLHFLRSCRRMRTASPTPYEMYVVSAALLCCRQQCFHWVGNAICGGANPVWEQPEARYQFQAVDSIVFEHEQQFTSLTELIIIRTERAGRRMHS